MKEWSKGSSWSHGCSPSCSCPHCPSLEEKPATCSFQVPLGAGVCTPVVPFACCLRGKFLVTGKCELSGYLICAVAPLLQADALCLCKFSLYSVNTSVEATYCIVKKKKNVLHVCLWYYVVINVKAKLASFHLAAPRGLEQCLQCTCQ